MADWSRLGDRWLGSSANDRCLDWATTLRHTTAHHRTPLLFENENTAQNEGDSKVSGSSLID